MNSYDLNDIGGNELLEELAGQNHAAAISRIPFGNLTTVEASHVGTEACWLVKCNGEIMDWFETRREAEEFAQKHDTLLPEGKAHGGGKRAH